MKTETIIYDQNNVQVIQEDYDQIVRELNTLRQAMEVYGRITSILQEEIIKLQGEPIMISQSQLDRVNLN